jgi:carbonic anhydrase
MTHNASTPLSAQDALARLCNGNVRFAAGRAQHPHQDPARRASLLAGQKPCAAILACADSRIPPEIIFDQGLGDIFVVRVAGSIVDDVVLASLEYAAAHLGVSLIVVLAHSACGAVAATAEGGAPEGHLPALTAALAPSVEEARAASGDLIENAARANCRRMARSLRAAAPVLAGLVETERLTVAAGYYDQATGRVEILEH